MNALMNAMLGIWFVVIVIVNPASWVLPIICFFKVSGVKVIVVIMLVVNHFCGGSVKGASMMKNEGTLHENGLHIWVFVDAIVKTIITIVCINWLWSK